MSHRPGAPTTTAHRHWDAVWRSAQGRADWSDPDPWVVGSIPLLSARGVRRTLDLGCGVGRHALCLAAAGFACAAIDASSSAISAAAAAARQAGLHVDLRQGGFTELPFADGALDHVLAFNAIYHGDEPAAGAALAEIRRVLRPGGVYQCTMLSKRNRHHGRGVEISANTFVQPDAGDDKVHPHLYCDANDLLRLHAGLELLAAEDCEQAAPGSHHWRCLFENPRRAGK
ncbi:MAG TPA: class I SAM-dependent methyltransferase [Kofleriaceae bacterium]|nr:class I SAM-dependent methyltransferase [Kofleriaceae bacterium]